MIPDESELKRWATSEWPDYQTWIFHHAFITEKKWRVLNEQATLWQSPPLISVVIPVYNTDAQYLRECICSVLTQANPNWEMCIVDDGSDHDDVIPIIEEYVVGDSRIKFNRLPENAGICHATNKAISMAEGEYIAFLDHDDRLSPDALYYVADAIIKNRELDMLYSDRDMLSPRGYRFMHLMKPDWSPETLFAFNYTCHLSVYRKTLIDKIGGLNPDFEGSQDHDLILRASELNPNVHHIPRVLYHWRQHDKSVALSRKTKIYIYDAVIRALKAALERRGFEGDVSEIPELWRGNFRVRLKRPSPETFTVISLDELENLDHFTQILLNKISEVHPKEYVIILGPGIKTADEEMFQEMISWFQIPEVGIVTGKIIDEQKRIVHAGMVLKPDGTNLSVYQGLPVETPGYMAASSIARNVSVPHPYCFAIRKCLLEEIEEGEPRYIGPHSIYDLSLRMLQKGLRIVYTPFASFRCDNSFNTYTNSIESDKQFFMERWHDWLKKGDPYYNKSLALTHIDMRLNLECD